MEDTQQQNGLVMRPQIRERLEAESFVDVKHVGLVKLAERRANLKRGAIKLIGLNHCALTLKRKGEESYVGADVQNPIALSNMEPGKDCLQPQFDLAAMTLDVLEFWEGYWVIRKGH